jgi:hypothetical protein
MRVSSNESVKMQVRRSKAKIRHIRATNLIENHAIYFRKENLENSIYSFTVLLENDL